MMKYVVVSNFPDDECLEKDSHLEYKTFKEGLNAFLDCVERASLSVESLPELDIKNEEEDETIPDIKQLHTKLHTTFFNGAIMEYFVGDRVYSLYRCS